MCTSNIKVDVTAMSSHAFWASVWGEVMLVDMENEQRRPTHFQLDVDLSAVKGNPAGELSRILRYWAGKMKHYDFAQSAAEKLYDSEYRGVGDWTLS